jgi:hypothetical protein
MFGQQTNFPILEPNLPISAVSSFYSIVKKLKMSSAIEPIISRFCLKDSDNGEPYNDFNSIHLHLFYECQVKIQIVGTNSR